MNNTAVLRMILSCYISTEAPDYTEAEVYVNRLKENLNSDDETRIAITEFYSKWSTEVKMNRNISFDPNMEILRQRQYKDLADNGIAILKQVRNKTHRYYYLFANLYFNKWDYENALEMIDKSLELIQKDPQFTLPTTI